MTLLLLLVWLFVVMDCRRDVVAGVPYTGAQQNSRGGYYPPAYNITN